MIFLNFSNKILQNKILFLIFSHIFLVFLMCHLCSWDRVYTYMYAHRLPVRDNNSLKVWNILFLTKFVNTRNFYFQVSFWILRGHFSTDSEIQNSGIKTKGSRQTKKIYYIILYYVLLLCLTYTHIHTCTHAHMHTHTNIHTHTVFLLLNSLNIFSTVKFCLSFPRFPFFLFLFTLIYLSLSLILFDLYLHFPWSLSPSAYPFFFLSSLPLLLPAG